MTDEKTAALLRDYAERYETREFLDGDPSWFMHQVEGRANQEATALVASCLSYGSRKQFMPKIQAILDMAGGDIDQWLRSGEYNSHFCQGDTRSFYRLYSYHTMHQFLSAYAQLLHEEDTLGNYVRRNASSGLTAVAAICRWFSDRGVSVVIPKDTKSACKRVCMFLRWMVRSNSPVDLGLWADIIDRRTLIMPLDTHVVSEAVRLGLLTSGTASMSVARRLTDIMAEVFPDDPLRGDFALFGYGVNQNK